LNPSSAYSLREYANFLAALGRFEEALQQLETARRVDPQSGSAARSQTMVLYYKRDYAAAEKSLEESAALETNQAGLPLWRARIAEARGDFEGALADTREALKLATGPVGGLRVAEVRNAALAGRKEEALAIRAALQREVDDGKIQINGKDLAYMELAFGHNENALQLLEQAVKAGDPNAVYFGVDPRVDVVRGTPRFRQLLKTIGLPAALAEAR
jgi:tetratricopeptide (TPR) repeat protein